MIKGITSLLCPFYLIHSQIEVSWISVKRIGLLRIEKTNVIFIQFGNSSRVVQRLTISVIIESKASVEYTNNKIDQGTKGR